MQIGNSWLKGLAVIQLIYSFLIVGPQARKKALTQKGVCEFHLGPSSCVSRLTWNIAARLGQCPWVHLSQLRGRQGKAAAWGLLFCSLEDFHHPQGGEFLAS